MVRECCKCGATDADFIRPRPGRKPMCRPCDNRIQREGRYLRLGRRRAIGEVEDFACSVCGRVFSRVATAGKERSACDDCLREARNARARDKWREGYLRRAYGISVERFDAMFHSQDGMCRICGTREPGGRHGEFVVDHCHETGAVRSLLCTNCNTGIGLFRENPAALAAAIDYLRLYSRGEVA